MHGFELITLPVTHPGVEQKATWLQVRQQRPDYVFLWGWGVMNSTSIKEAIADRLPAREDVRRVVVRGRARRDPRRAMARRATTPSRCSTPRAAATVHKDILKYVYDKGQGTGQARRRSARCSTTAA